MRWMLRLVMAMLVIGASHAADLPQSDQAMHRKAPRHGHTAMIEEESDLLFTPSDGFPRIHFPPGTPLLLGSSALPGFYGTTHSYEYQGPYYGGTNINYRFQLPYACGVLGYC
ncbi:MAG TPA: hypothetical protein VKT76_06105 [Bradyrhizobium sp.]|nr:hypothetical protein [Bradyrhizobium sp.]